MITVAIDPGIWALGWALFRDRVLIAAGCSKVGPKHRNPNLVTVASTHASTIRHEIGQTPWRSVLEHMAERGKDSPVKVADLIAVQIVGDLVAQGLAPLGRLLTAQEWKGSVPKDVHHPRIRAALGPGELAICYAAALAAGANAKEVLDAIGIGLYDAGRIDAKGERT